ncbi:hypothetical protein FACS1894132_00350 [Clostridia bacterium]|nr:hypothetical protein FACS1894132_00350 [Clostridia bacterium]
MKENFIKKSKTKSRVIGAISVLLLVGILVVTAVFLSADDEDEFTISTVVKDITASVTEPSQTFTLEIRLDNIPTGGYDNTLKKNIAQGLSSVEFSIEYDSSVISFDPDNDGKINFTEGPLSANGAIEREKEFIGGDWANSCLAVNYSNKLNILWTTGLSIDDSQYYLHGSGVLLTLQGKITGDVPAKKYNFSIVPSTDISGLNQTFDFGVFVDNDTYDMKKYTPIIKNGFINLQGETATIYGDVDLDGSAGKIADVVLLGKYVASKITLTGQGLVNANCDTRDLAVNVADLQAIIKYMLKQISVLPYV